MRQDFTLHTGQDLIDLCGSSPKDEFHEQAKLVCYGYLEGVAQFYDEAVREKRIRRVYCDPSEVTRSQAAEAIVMWAKPRCLSYVLFARNSVSLCRRIHPGWSFSRAG